MSDNQLNVVGISGEHTLLQFEQPQTLWWSDKSLRYNYERHCRLMPDYLGQNMFLYGLDSKILSEMCEPSRFFRLLAYRVFEDLKLVNPVEIMGNKEASREVGIMGRLFPYADGRTEDGRFIWYSDARFKIDEDKHQYRKSVERLLSAIISGRGVDIETDLRQVLTDCGPLRCFVFNPTHKRTRDVAERYRELLDTYIEHQSEFSRAFLAYEMVIGIHERLNQFEGRAGYSTIVKALEQALSEINAIIQSIPLPEECRELEHLLLDVKENSR